MTPATLETTFDAMPATVDRHPRLVQHAERRVQIVAQLGDQRAAHTRLTEESHQLQRDRVRVLADTGKAASLARDKRLATLADELATLEDSIGVHVAALEEIDRGARGVREAAIGDMTSQIRAEARLLAERQLTLITELQQLHARLEQLHGYGLVPLADSLVAGNFLPIMTDGSQRTLAGL